MTGFWKKLIISASNGCFGKIFIFIPIGIIGFVGIKFIIPNDDSWTKLIMPIYVIILFFMGYFFGHLHTIVNWWNQNKADNIKALQLKKDILELEIKKKSSQDQNGNLGNEE